MSTGVSPAVCARCRRLHRRALSRLRRRAHLLFGHARGAQPCATHSLERTRTRVGNGDDRTDNVAAGQQVSAVEQSHRLYIANVEFAQQACQRRRRERTLPRLLMRVRGQLHGHVDE